MSQKFPFPRRMPHSWKVVSPPDVATATRSPRESLALGREFRTAANRAGFGMFAQVTGMCALVPATPTRPRPPALAMLEREVGERAHMCEKGMRGFSI